MKLLIKGHDPIEFIEGSEESIIFHAIFMRLWPDIAKTHFPLIESLDFGGPEHLSVQYNMVMPDGERESFLVSRYLFLHLHDQMHRLLAEDTVEKERKAGPVRPRL